MYDLGCIWYAGRMELDWEPYTAAEAQAKFEAVGLVSDFWSMS